ncbi:MAG: hypothetical protein CM15mP85_28830 [Rhodobacterales bacterium]|nr:MAG: hypothetical protein CM15mP85_28830 [Rhodobacterales bacterium]
MDQKGGTGAAPGEFTDHLGSPLRDAIVFVDNALIGAGIRDRFKKLLRQAKLLVLTILLEFVL